MEISIDDLYSQTNSSAVKQPVDSIGFPDFTRKSRTAKLRKAKQKEWRAWCDKLPEDKKEIIKVYTQSSKTFCNNALSWLAESDRWHGHIKNWKKKGTAQGL